MFEQQPLTFSAFHLFCGIGGGSRGLKDARQTWQGIPGVYETLGGIDSDPEACQDFENITGVPATCMDLFSREQYVAWHGKEPPADWREALPEDIRRAAGGRTPELVFLSPPCKGMSGLLPKAKAADRKYQALNQLVVRGLFLALEAFKDDLPAVFLLENVPRITVRGAKLLREVKGLLSYYGYEFHEGFYDCGEIGGLAQHRRRYFKIARLPEKVPNFIYLPPTKRVRACGEVLGALPLPDDPVSGPMHRLPRLQWKTWVRLALIPAGGDWRDLGHATATSTPEPDCCDVEDLSVKSQGHPGGYGVLDWDRPAPTVRGAARIMNTTGSVADPRMSTEPPATGEGWFNHAYRIVPFDSPAGTVTGGHSPSSGGITVADTRFPDTPGRHASHYRVLAAEEPAATVTGATHLANGALSVADTRLGYEPRKGAFRVLPWDEPSTAVIGSASVRGSNGAAAVADTRLGHTPRAGVFQVNPWDAPTGPVVGAAVADTRLGCKPRNGTFGVIPWDQPAPTVIGAGDVHAGTAAVSDPRPPEWDDRPDPPPVIIALDGTWHRPLTTYELAMLQGFPTHLLDGRPFQLTGKSDARHRERIGNAVPPPAAQAIGEAILYSLIPSALNRLTLGSTPIWVAPEADSSGEQSHDSSSTPVS